MPGLYAKYIKLINSIGDTASIAVSLGAAQLYTGGTLNGFLTWETGYFFAFSLVAWFLCNSLLGTGKVYRVRMLKTVPKNTFKALLLYMLLVEAVLSLLNLNLFPRTFMLVHYLLLGIIIIGWRISVIKLLRHFRRRGYNNKKVIIIGYSETGLLLSEFLQSHPEHGYNFIGFFDDHETDNPDVMGKLKDVEQFVTEHAIDEIYCSPSGISKDQLTKLLDFVDENFVRMKLIPDLGSYQFKRLKVDFNDVLPVLMIRSIPLDDVINKALKRGFDILFSLTVIVFLLSWLLPILAILIKLTSKGPIFFKQIRSGLDNEKFHCYKLRTMYVNTAANSQLARRGDSRITPIGAFLRKTSMDELPQFFNVLFGQMSIVGPRPHMLKADEEYAMVAEKYKVRHFVKPGITGLSQVRGYRGDTTETYQIRGRVKLDIFYLENWSFLLDLKIIFYTVYNVIRGDKHAF
ncbi:MAG: undecaprenyl-phosphate glucose phosphotransferase [Hymenobacteraceae bacterium]|nr:undecaprenyl-phosphate glucose phosphotransferase [Hymenobacteraceae bacterium]